MGCIRAPELALPPTAAAAAAAAARGNCRARGSGCKRPIDAQGWPLQTVASDVFGGAQLDRPRASCLLA
eukprot:9671325-Alexandrium_andersonii.AAC.1